MQQSSLYINISRPKDAVGPVGLKMQLFEIAFLSWSQTNVSLSKNGRQKWKCFHSPQDVLILGLLRYPVSERLTKV